MLIVSLQLVSYRAPFVFFFLVILVMVYTVYRVYAHCSCISSSLIEQSRFTVAAD